MIDPIHFDYTNTPVSSQRPRFDYAPMDLFASPAVTIITPFYNTGALFHETARSVLRQSMQQWEWLIINDGSTEPEALAILNQYRQQDPRIRVIDHAENRGLSAARNTGFYASRTPYVVQLDSDDLLEPTAVEKWAWFLESHSEFSFVKGYSVGFGAQEYLWEKGFHNGSAFLEANLVNPTSMIRKSVHSLVGGYDEADRGGLMDWDFWLRCANQGFWVELYRSISTGIVVVPHIVIGGPTSIMASANGPTERNCEQSILSCGPGNSPRTRCAQPCCMAPCMIRSHGETFFEETPGGSCFSRRG